jgi:hypothetical protein
LLHSQTCARRMKGVGGRVEADGALILSGTLRRPSGIIAHRLHHTLRRRRCLEHAPFGCSANMLMAGLPVRGSVGPGRRFEPPLGGYPPGPAKPERPVSGPGSPAQCTPRASQDKPIQERPASSQQAPRARRAAQARATKHEPRHPVLSPSSVGYSVADWRSRATSYSSPLHCFERCLGRLRTKGPWLLETYLEVLLGKYYHYHSTSTSGM